MSDHKDVNMAILLVGVTIATHTHTHRQQSAQLAYGLESNTSQILED